MPVVALELNDAGISAVSDGARDTLAIAESPGYALVEDGSIVTGVDARARARLKPRFTHTRFWDALDTTPLSRPFPNKLNRADLEAVLREVTLEKQASTATEFDSVHTVERARDVGSLSEIFEPAELRPRLIAALEDSRSGDSG